MEIKVECNGDFILVQDKKMFYRRDKSTKKYLLKEVTQEEIFELRLGDEPAVILKVDGKFFYAQISKDTRLSSLGEHKCGTCRRCLPSSDENGGCAKVRDVSADRISKQDFPNEVELMDFSKRIEKYEFITSGIEIFNVRQDGLLVLECENFQNYKKKDPIPLEDVIAIKQGILDFYNNGLFL